MTEILPHPLIFEFNPTMVKLPCISSGHSSSGWYCSHGASAISSMSPLWEVDLGLQDTTSHFASFPPSCKSIIEPSSYEHWSASGEWANDHGMFTFFPSVRFVRYTTTLVNFYELLMFGFHTGRSTVLLGGHSIRRLVWGSWKIIWETQKHTLWKASFQCPNGKIINTYKNKWWL